MSFVLEALKRQEAGTHPEAAVSLARAGVLRRRHRLWMAVAAVAMAVNAALLLWVFGPLGQRTPSPAPTDAAVRDPAPTLADAGAPAQGGSVPAQRAPAAVATRDATAQAGAPDGSGQAAAGAAEPPGPAQAPTRSSADTSIARSRTRNSHPSQAAPPVPRAGPSAPAAASPGVTTRADARPSGPATITLGDLPPDARSRFPGIAFSTHIYADDPALRAVFANGARHREGDRIRGLEILEITESGVVLAFERYRVEVPMVVDWDAL